MKIALENQTILKRLREKRSWYKVRDWEDDFKKREKILHKMCEYPYILESKKQHFGLDYPQTNNLSTILTDNYFKGQNGLGSPGLPRLTMSSLESRGCGGMNTTFNVTRDGISKSAYVVKQADILDENRIVLYKKGKQISNGYYIVEISSNNTHLFIAAYDVETPESLLLEVSERKA
mmetsp:Transcript_17341/g.16546  ORF Transcript_17341/g.16546 Transcript_17341/m.16546 type:complete len:177 (+) Transcript_17341:387-917(+)